VKTLILEEPGKLRYKKTDSPGHAAKGEALVRVHRIGVCGTDIHAFAGKQPFFSYPRILGHELAVEILALGETEAPSDLKVGDFCAVEPYLNCGMCSTCQRGFPNACMTLKVLGVHIDGGMREVIIVPIRKLHRTTLPVEQIAMVEMLSIGAHAVRRSRLAAGESALVIGAGPIGLGAMTFARLLGANVIAMDVNPARLAFSREVVEIEHQVNVHDESLAQLEQLLGGELPSVVFDATGSLGSMMKAFQYIAHGGRLVFVGLAQGDITFNDPDFHRREITLMASRNATPQDFQWVIESLEQGKISVEAWITHQALVEEFPLVFPNWLQPDSGLVKGMLRF
jgi:2-desacetyl-2-hydroxyethyl bacteriochlorophyllide A dehydrogenase